MLEVVVGEGAQREPFGLQGLLGHGAEAASAGRRSPAILPRLRIVYSTRVTGHVRASRSEVYRALLDPEAVAAWRVPHGMTAAVHEFDVREGGAFRISLTYDDAGETGKSGGHTDTYGGRFTRLVPDEQVVEVSTFETDEPALATEMTMTTTLVDAGEGPTSRSCTRASPTPYRPPTTRPAPEWRWRTWRGWWRGDSTVGTKATGGLAPSYPTPTRFA